MSPSNPVTHKMNVSSQLGSSRPGNQTPSLQPGQDLVEYLKTYAREKPDVAALWCFGLGIVVGWKIKPW